MANTEDILAELDALLGGAPTPSLTTTASPGLNLLGNLDAEYSAAQRFQPSTGDILAEALIPSKKAAWNTLVGLGDMAGTGADYAKYGLSYLDPFVSYGSEYRAAEDLLAEKAKKDAAKADEDRRVALKLSPDRYAELKAQEANKEYRHLAAQVGGGLGGAYAGGAAGAPLAPFTFGLSIPIGAGIGAYLGSGGTDLATQQAEESLGWSKPTTAMEKARMFSEAGTSGLVGEMIPGAIKAGTKATVKTSQAARGYLGPKTLEDALATVRPSMEKAMPAAKVREAEALGLATEKTSDLKTTGELLNTPEALAVEQAVGLHPTQQGKYNPQLASNIEKGQARLAEDLAKNLEKETTSATPKVDVDGKPIKETAIGHLQQGEVSTATIGDELKAAYDDAAKKSHKELSGLYAGVPHAETRAAGLKFRTKDALSERYPLVEGAKSKTGAVNLRPSGAPSELIKLEKDIASKKSFTALELHQWQSQLREMAERFVRNGNKTAAGVAGKIRTVLIEELEATAAGEKWTGAKQAAKKQADLIENHELGKVLSKEDLNAEKIFNKVTATESDAKNFIALVGLDHPASRALKAYGIKTLENLSPAQKASWIENNNKWLKHFFDQDGLASLKETASIGRRAGEKGQKLNPAGNSATAGRLSAARSGLDRILGRGTDTVSDVGKANAQTMRALRQLGIVSGVGLSGAAASYLTDNPIGKGLLGGLGGAAAILGGGKVLGRRAAGMEMLRDAAYEIAMNPKTAGTTAPALAAALTAKQARQLKAAGLVGESTGRIGQAGAYGGQLLPEKVEEVKTARAARPTSAHAAAADALKSLEAILGKAPAAAVAPTTPTPSASSVKRTSASDKHLASKPAIIQAMAEVESGGNDKAVSPKGARGRLQLMPRTAKALGVKNIDDPIENIDAGERYFNQQVKEFGDERIALVAYNWGPGRVEKARERLAKRGKKLTWANIQRYIKLPDETSNHIELVMKAKKRFEGA